MLSSFDEVEFLGKRSSPVVVLVEWWMKNRRCGARVRKKAKNQLYNLETGKGRKMTAKSNLLQVKLMSNNSSLFTVIKNYLFPITLWTRCSALYKMKGWWCRDEYQWQQTNTHGKAERQTGAHEFCDHLANIGQFSAAHKRTEEMHLWICVVRAKEQERNIAMHCMKVGSSIEFAGIACSTKVGEKSHMNMNNSAATVQCGGWASDFIEAVAAYRCSYVICARFLFMGIRMQGIGEWDYLLDL